MISASSLEKPWQKPLRLYHCYHSADGEPSSLQKAIINKSPNTKFKVLPQRPPRLDLENYPHLPLAQVRTTQASEYMALLGEVNS